MRRIKKKIRIKIKTNKTNKRSNQKHLKHFISNNDLIIYHAFVILQGSVGPSSVINDSHPTLIVQFAPFVLKKNSDNASISSVGSLIAYVNDVSKHHDKRCMAVRDRLMFIAEHTTTLLHVFYLNTAA